MGPSCGLKTCNWNGIYDASTDQCVCMEGFQGDDCTECGEPISSEDSSSSSDGSDKNNRYTYICVERKHPTQKDRKEFMLLAVPEHEADFYVNNEAPMTVGGKRDAIYPDSDYKEFHYDCACRGTPKSTEEEEEEDEGDDDLRVRSRGIDDILNNIIMEPRLFQVRTGQQMAMEMYDCMQEELSECQFEFGLCAAYFPIIFLIVILLLFCTLVAMFVLAPVRKRED